MNQVTKAAAVTERSLRTAAVIDIGTTSIRLAVAEIGQDGHVRKLETLAQAVSLGKDTFTGGTIARSTIEECVRVLRSYRSILEEYQIDSPSQIRVVATSAVREARNRLAFLDRVYIATGLEVEPLDEAEVNRITYLGIEPQLREDAALASARALVTEVGGGSTELLMVRGGDVVFAATYRLGSLRLRKTIENLHAPTRRIRELMESHIQRVVHQIRKQVSNVLQGESVELVALGGDVRWAASRLVDDFSADRLVRLPVEALESLAGKITRLTDEEIVQRYHVPWPEAETLGAALLSYWHLAQAFQRPYLLVSSVNLRDGLLQEMAVQRHWSRDFSEQIIRSALDLGRRYSFDEPHARHVAELSRTLFRQLRGLHKLSPRHEVILYVAALLHEIGQFVNVRSHHKHALYLIRNSELFGLSRQDLLLVALTARYHRRSSPQPTHAEYAALSRDDRVAVAAMASLLRLAIALDESRTQRVRDVECVMEDNSLVIYVGGVENLALEQLAMRQNSTLFEETFGMGVQVLPRREPADN
ncbi:MAG: exopolyphosphatase [Pirellulaceae bacterium]|nr:MAG: exopolyphosphatase [Pirellulaceae bacterium]